jgi:hypothetical protein
MPQTQPFFSTNEAKKPVAQRVYHDNSECVPGREIQLSDRRDGTASYERCKVCDRLSRESH